MSHQLTEWLLTYFWGCDHNGTGWRSRLASLRLPMHRYGHLTTEPCPPATSNGASGVWWWASCAECFLLGHPSLDTRCCKGPQLSVSSWNGSDSRTRCWARTSAAQPAPGKLDCPQRSRFKTAGGVAMILEKSMDPKNNVPEDMANKALDSHEKYKAESLEWIVFTSREWGGWQWRHQGNAAVLVYL